MQNALTGRQGTSGGIYLLQVLDEVDLPVQRIMPCRGRGHHEVASAVDCLEEDGDQHQDPARAHLPLHCDRLASYVDRRRQVVGATAREGCERADARPPTSEAGDEAHLHETRGRRRGCSNTMRSPVCVRAVSA
eukprot:5257845-Prymnesium_polylepis.3